MNPDKPSSEAEKVFQDDREGKTAGTTFGAAAGAPIGHAVRAAWDRAGQTEPSDR